MPADFYDAVVIGAGPNGLVAANKLVDAGWSVLLIEEQPVPGGAVRSGELIEPGFINDQFSAFYPLAKASPAIGGLRLEDHGLRWLRGDVAVAHPRADGTVSFVHQDIATTAANLDSFAAGDGDSWRDLYAQWERLGDALLGMLFAPLPAAGALAKILRKAKPAELLQLGKVATSGARQQTNDWFNGDGARRLLAGNALHADLAPNEPPSAVYGWVLMCLAQSVGYPVPEGGAGKLSRAMADRFESRGGTILLNTQVTGIRLNRGIAEGVEFSGGSVTARKAVLADVGAPQLYLDLIGADHLPASVVRNINEFTYDDATVKIDWTLDAPIPWANEDVRRSGTVHVAEGIDALDKQASEITRGLVPETPYLVMGQYAQVDPSRAPEGKDTAWAYTHVPQEVRGDAASQLAGDWCESDRERMTERVEAEVEKLAPGFRDLIRGRHVMLPPDFAGFNRNLVNGAVNGGTSSVRQQLVFRPIPGVGRSETPFKRLFLASASAHPGGGVHGAVGANAARAAIAADAKRPGALIAGTLARRLAGTR